jgi:hypothetical protein
LGITETVIDAGHPQAVHSLRKITGCRISGQHFDRIVKIISCDSSTNKTNPGSNPVDIRKQKGSTFAFIRAGARIIFSYYPGRLYNPGILHSGHFHTPVKSDNPGNTMILTVVIHLNLNPHLKRSKRYQKPIIFVARFHQNQKYAWG